MQFLILAYDATDADALTRRMRAREAHLKLVDENKAKGHARYGAAIIGESGVMIGSMMVVEYPTRTALDAWLAEEPYVTQNVWSDVSIQECRIAPSFV
mgnify:CR=1 FL=1